MPQADRDANVAFSKPCFAVRCAVVSCKVAHGGAGVSMRDSTRARSASVMRIVEAKIQGPAKGSDTTQGSPNVQRWRAPRGVIFRYNRLTTPARGGGFVGSSHHRRCPRFVNREHWPRETLRISGRTSLPGAICSRTGKARGCRRGAFSCFLCLAAAGVRRRATNEVMDLR